MQVYSNARLKTETPALNLQNEVLSQTSLENEIIFGIGGQPLKLTNRESSSLSVNHSVSAMWKSFDPSDM